MNNSVTTLQDVVPSKPNVKIICLSDEGATKNLMVYECGDDIIVVDCGVEFPDSETLGVDVIIPDFSYLLDNKQKVRAIFITHGHDDHFGAIPYLIDDLNVPIYSNALVQEYLKILIEDRKGPEAVKRTRFKMFNTESKVQVGNFTVSAVGLNHSVPDSLGLIIDTPQGRFLHFADYKIDEEPVIDKPVDLEKIRQISSQKVLCFLSDCLGADVAGNVATEASLNKPIFDLFTEFDGRQMFISTISSNVSRMKQIVEGALKHNRKIVFAGRSVIQKGEIAVKLGYLPKEKSVYVPLGEAASYDQGSLVYIVAGCFGQKGSAVDRLSRKELRGVRVEKNACMIFSAEPNPPGTDVDVERVQHEFVTNGFTLIYPPYREHLHVGGHGRRDELKQMAQIVMPKYFVPIGGQAFKMRAYRDMTEELGYKPSDTFELQEGQNVIFSEDGAKLGDRLSVRQVFVEGSRIHEENSPVMSDRVKLSGDGILVVVVPISKKDKKPIGKPEVITRGFIQVDTSRDFIRKIEGVVSTAIKKNSAKGWGTTKKKIEHEVNNFLYKQTKSTPLIIVHGITI